MWPNLSQMKPEPVPSSLASLSSIGTASLEEPLELLAIAKSLMKTTDGEVSYKTKYRDISFTKESHSRHQEIQRHDVSGPMSHSLYTRPKISSSQITSP